MGFDEPPEKKENKGMKKPKRTRGFGMIEILVFLVALGGLAAYAYPKIQEIRKQEALANKAHATTILESAKNQYDQSARLEEKGRFAAAGDAERFAILSYLITPKDPETFTKTYGLSVIRIKDFGKDVEVE